MPNNMERPVYRLAEVDSTNDEAKRLFAQNSGEFVVVAERQNAGRGRRQRVWQAAPGLNLTASFVVRPSFLSGPEAFLLSEAAAVAAVFALRSLAPPDIQITAKWPNDVTVMDRKIAGILIENVWLGEKWEYAVVGFGINVNQTEFDGEFRAASLAMMHAGKPQSVERTLYALSEIFWDRVERLKAGDKDGVEREYHAVWGDKGRSARLNDDGETGIPLRVRRDGRIEIQTPTGLKIYSLDEVRLQFASPIY